MFDPLLESSETVYLGLADGQSWSSFEESDGGGHPSDPADDMDHFSKLWRSWSSTVEQGKHSYVLHDCMQVHVDVGGHIHPFMLNPTSLQSSSLSLSLSLSLSPPLSPSLSLSLSPLPPKPIYFSVNFSLLIQLYVGSEVRLPATASLVWPTLVHTNSSSSVVEFPTTTIGNSSVRHCNLNKCVSTRMQLERACS